MKKEDFLGSHLRERCDPAFVTVSRKIRSLKSKLDRIMKRRLCISLKKVMKLVKSWQDPLKTNKTIKISIQVDKDIVLVCVFTA